MVLESRQDSQGSAGVLECSSSPQTILVCNPSPSPSASAKVAAGTPCPGDHCTVRRSEPPLTRGQLWIVDSVWASVTDVSTATAALSPGHPAERGTETVEAPRNAHTHTHPRTLTHMYSPSHPSRNAFTASCHSVAGRRGRRGGASTAAGCLHWNNSTPSPTHC